MMVIKFKFPEPGCFHTTPTCLWGDNGQRNQTNICKPIIFLDRRCFWKFEISGNFEINIIFYKKKSLSLAISATIFYRSKYWAISIHSTGIFHLHINVWQCVLCQSTSNCILSILPYASNSKHSNVMSPPPPPPLYAFTNDQS